MTEQRVILYNDVERVQPKETPMKYLLPEGVKPLDTVFVPVTVIEVQDDTALVELADDSRSGWFSGALCNREHDTHWHRPSTFRFELGQNKGIDWEKMPL